MHDFFKAFVKEPITAKHYEAAAKVLGCEVATIKAVAKVESPRGAFDKQDRCTILYERHVFARCTNPLGRFDASYPYLSGYRKPYGPGEYGSFDEQYVKLDGAYELDPVAALKACSWGRFQILGENFQACGFGDVESFVAKMCRSERAHLDVFVAFIASSGSRLTALRNNDWTTFARMYNGPNFASFQYDTKLAEAYRVAKGATEVAGDSHA